MKLIFVYDEDKDAECLIRFGSHSSNSIKRTSVYEKLYKYCSGNITTGKAKSFIKGHIKGLDVNVTDFVKKYSEEWIMVSDAFVKIAENIFKISLPIKVVAYLTINTRCPYNIKDKYFFVTFPMDNSNIVAFHEIWHFYTWYKFGASQIEIIGGHKYNIIKEALTVIINAECETILLPNMIDKGYSQHQELRYQLLETWNNTKDIEKVWEYALQLCY